MKLSLWWSRRAADGTDVFAVHKDAWLEFDKTSTSLEKVGVDASLATPYRLSSDGLVKHKHEVNFASSYACFSEQNYRCFTDAMVPSKPQTARTLCAMKITDRYRSSAYLNMLSQTFVTFNHFDILCSADKESI